MKLLKLKNYLFLIVLGLIVTDCSKKEEPKINDLLGKWTVSAATMDITVNGQSFVQYYVNVLGMSTADAQQFADLFKTLIEQEFNGSTFEFKSNNTYTVTLTDSTSTGTYSLNSAGDKLTMDAGTANETVWNVKSLTSSALNLEFLKSDSEDLNGDSVNEIVAIDITLSLHK